MLSFIAQYDKQHGPDGAHQYKLILDIDESHKAGFKGIMEFTKGDTFLVTLTPINEEEFTTVTEALNETEEMKIIRFRKRMHALIREVAEKKGLTIDEVRTSLKEMLKKKNYLKTSTSELDAKGFTAGIFMLQNNF